MRPKAVYGENLSDHWRGHCAVSSITAGETTAGAVTIARLTGGRDFGFVEPVPAEESYAFSLELMNYQSGELWLDGRSTQQTELARNNSVFFDLRHRVEAKLEDPFDFLHFHIPRAYFDALARASGLARIQDLNFTSGRGVFDETIHHIGQVLLPAVASPREVNRLFLDHVITAFCVHVTTTYGARVEPRTTARGLSEWRLKRAKELIESQLDGKLTIAEIARECGLTPSYFAQQFAEATGMTPHRWLLKARVDAATRLLVQGALPIAAIAIACGFADQSHFTRTFSRVTGVTPKVWQDRFR
ncbi:AraC family transcriptional regulator [Neoroseomonas lacus]|uniref:AraC family transcriptional regulator n=1 Tax=Neoroseomonas lacus TaxID=287609 RepID=A0A917NPW6_9PROT|nr:AraC family transcriptional regulator [Neoroseomonas lacus]